MLRPSKIINYCFLALLSLALVLGIGVIPVHSTSNQHDLANSSSSLEQQAQQSYEAGQFDKATQLLKQAAANSAAKGDELPKVRKAIIS